MRLRPYTFPAPQVAVAAGTLRLNAFSLHVDGSSGGVFRMSHRTRDACTAPALMFTTSESLPQDWWDQEDLLLTGTSSVLFFPDDASVAAVRLLQGEFHTLHFVVSWRNPDGIPRHMDMVIDGGAS